MLTLFELYEFHERGQLCVLGRAFPEVRFYGRSHLVSKNTFLPSPYMRESGGKYISLFKFSILYFKNEERVKCPTWMCGCANSCLVAQSEEVQETTKFLDETPGVMEGWSVPTDEIDAGDAADTASLEQFLGRPVRIFTTTWAQTSPIGVLDNIYPWSLYLSEPRIAKKLANFAYLRGNLHIKAVVNGSPFYYGMARYCYQPLPNFKTSTILGAGFNRLIPYSQQPGMVIRPGLNQGGELTCPFVWPKTWFRLGVDSTDDLGNLKLLIYSVLKSANGVTGQSVNTTLYAWLSDVELSSSTVIPQSTEKDEYGQGPVSAPATAIANAASKLKSVPILGRYAAATEIGARATASIAKLFGYTNVPVISNTAPFAPAVGPVLASTEQGFPLSKLTVDAKNELAVNPQATGLSDKDELVIANIVGHESYIATFSWATTNIVNDLMFSSRVTPYMYATSSNTTNTLVDQTPMCYLTPFFRNWRGDIIFRFNIIASKYHKGRLLVSFDPSGSVATNVLNTVDTTTAVYTRVIDIAETNNIEFRVPYQQALAFLELQSPTYTVGDVPFTDATFNSAVGAYANGYITVRVLNELSAPVAVAPVDILVYVRGADNFEFANPRDNTANLSMYIAQSDEVTEDVLTDTTPHEDPQRSRVYMGERILSMRPLMRRYAYVGPFNMGVSASANTNWVTTSYVFHKLPPFYGYDFAGENNATKLVGTGNAPFNYVPHNVLNWLTPMFLYYRGSVNWTFNVDGSSAKSSVMVRRLNSSVANGRLWSNLTMGIDTPSFASLINVGSAIAGSTFTNQILQPCISVAAPNYTPYKFQSTNANNATNPPTSGSGYDGSSLDAYAVQVSGLGNNANTVVHRYAGAGTDFNLHFLLNVPTLYKYASYPAAV